MYIDNQTGSECSTEDGSSMRAALPELSKDCDQTDREVTPTLGPVSVGCNAEMAARCTKKKLVTQGIFDDGLAVGIQGKKRYHLLHISTTYVLRSKNHHAVVGLLIDVTSALRGIPDLHHAIQI